MNWTMPPEENWKDWFYIALGLVAVAVVYICSGGDFR